MTKFIENWWEVDFSLLEPDLQEYRLAVAEGRINPEQGVSSGRLSCTKPRSYYMDKQGNFRPEPYWSAF